VTRTDDRTAHFVHLALPADWTEALAVGTYRISTRGRTLADEGFIHCAYPHQVRGVADRFYGDVDELVVVHVDPQLVDAEIRIEPPADGVDERFPHVYGPIPVTAVVATVRWCRSDGLEALTTAASPDHP
jgi:uncharacterized protein (DUF952 family)